MRQHRLWSRNRLISPLHRSVSKARPQSWLLVCLNREIHTSKPLLLKMASWLKFLLVSSLIFGSYAVESAEQDHQHIIKDGKSAYEADTKPNVVFILTDDQDLHLDSLSYMPYLKQHLLDQGTFFRRHYCTIALCCPSRVSLWTGRAAHNTNVTDVNPPYGMDLPACNGSSRLIVDQGATQSSSVKGSMMRGFQSGCRKRGITLIILESFSMRIQSPTMTRHSSLALRGLHFYLTLSRTGIRTAPFRRTETLQLVMRANILQMCLRAKHTGSWMKLWPRRSRSSLPLPAMRRIRTLRSKPISSMVT